jgi:hypothetical protein
MFTGSQRRPFQKVNIEISNICNLQCSFCPEVVRSKGLMDLDLFREVIKQVAPLTEQVCFHLMGDPLVHPELQELVEVCSEYQVPIFLVTNGVLLREKQAQLLLHPAFRQVNFSLHSFFDNFQNRDPSVYLERIFSWTELAWATRPELYINYRLWNLDQTGLVGQKNKEMLLRVEDRFQFKMPDSVDVRSRKSYRVKNRLFLHFDTEFTWPSLDLPVLGVEGRCHGLSSHFGILVDGTVVPCCLDQQGSIALGNVKTQTISEILDAPRSQRILEGFKKRKLVEDLCQRCQYIERFQTFKRPQASDF